MIRKSPASAFVCLCMSLLVAVTGVAFSPTDGAAGTRAHTTRKNDICTQIVDNRTISFPEAQGFGRYALGGRGGRILEVTNLNDDGPGSLREAIGKTGPRIIVFRVSGIIRLKNKLEIEKPFCTIAGQTAPGDGITLADGSFKIDADHIIVRYIRSRMGPLGGAQDAISVKSGRHIILDHLSASWSVDETLSNQSDDVDSTTVQWCMVTESLNNSVHPEGDHGFGGIIGGLNQSYHHNLFAHHRSRLPKVTWRRPLFADFRNNVIYNWQSKNCYDGSDAHMNWVANYYKYGPRTQESKRLLIFSLEDDDEAENSRPCRLYAERNFVWGYPEVTQDNWNNGIEFSNGASEEKNRALEPFPCPEVEEQDAETAFNLVLARAGASAARDPVDTRVVGEVERGSYTYGDHGIIDSPEDVKGWPVHYSFDPDPDTDHDGMPDYWEDRAGLNRDDPSDNVLDRDRDGYTEVEEYLNSSNPLNDGKPVVFIISGRSQAIENQQKSAILILNRTGDISLPLTVMLSTQGTAGTDDFTSVPESITFQAGDSTRSLELIPAEDGLEESREYLAVSLDPSENYYIGCPGTRYIILLDDETISAVSGDFSGLPSSFALEQNYPNPFNSSTQIEFSMLYPLRVVLKIYSPDGRELMTLVNGWHQPGRFRISLDMSPYPAGVYVYSISMGHYRSSRKMILLN